MNDETTTAVAEEQGADFMATFLKLFKDFMAILLPFIGLDFLTKYLDEIG